MLQNFICLTGYVTEEMFIYDEIEMRQAFWETDIYKKKNLTQSWTKRKN